MPTNTFYLGLPRWISGKELVCQCKIYETRVQSLGQEEFLEECMAIHSNILAGESHGQRSLVGYSPQGRKELSMTEAT